MAGKNEKAAGSELDDLARRLLNLWQDQMTAVATNPDLANQAARLMAALPMPGMWPAAMNQGGFNPAGFNPGGMAADWWKGAHGFGNTGTSAPGTAPAAPTTTPGPAPAAPASGAGDVGLAELRGRLAELEGKLAELGGKSAKPAKKPDAGKRRPAARRTRTAAKPGEPGSTGGGAAG